MSIWAPWTSIGRARLRIDVLAGALRQYPTFHIQNNHTNAPGWEGIKQQKYPTKTPDTNVFEASRPEYSAIPKGAIQFDWPSPDMLPELVRDGRFEAAEQLYAECRARGIDVPPDAAYEGMAAWIVASRLGEEGSAEAFEEWLTLLPDADPSKTQLFPQLERHLLSSPSSGHLEMITRLGALCVDKGYDGFVRALVVPAAERVMSENVYQEFLRGLVSRMKQPLGISDTMLDAPLANLQEISPHLPGNESSVFEELSSEYISYARSLPSTATATTPDALTALIKSERFEEADQLLAEMQDLGIAIPHSLLYEKAALAAIDQYLTSTDQLSWFTRWFSLIPTASISGRRKFYRIRKRLLAAPATNLMLLMRFGCICASKGFAHNVYTYVLPPLMRYADGEVSMQFLKDFEAAHRAYCERHPTIAVIPEMRLARKLFRAVAIKALATAGREEFAVKLLPTPARISSGDDLPLPDNIRTLLNTRLRSRRQNPETEHLLELVEASFRSATCAQDEYTPTFTKPTTAVEKATLPAHLLALKSAIGAGVLPHAKTIISTISLYLSTGRTKALALLRMKALRAGPDIASRFIFAELVYYYRQLRYDLVLLTFYRHFYLTGFPRDVVLSRLHASEAFRRFRNSEFLGDWYAKHDKLYPSLYHCSLVWHALVGMTRQGQAGEVELLYDKFLRYAKGLPAEDPAHLSSFGIGIFDHALPPPPSWKHRVDDSAFVPFMRALCLRFGPSRGARVLHDMVSIGIQPTLYHYTELAGTYARIGDSKRAFMVLDRLESENMLSQHGVPSDHDEEGQIIGATFARQEPQETDDNEAEASRHPAPLTFPAPNIIFLTNLLRGFLVTRSVDNSSRVIEHMRASYELGSVVDPVLERALAAFEELGDAGPQEYTTGRVKERSSIKVIAGCMTGQRKVDGV